jgi:hypothetical protein
MVKVKCSCKKVFSESNLELAYRQQRIHSFLLTSGTNLISPDHKLILTKKKGVWRCLYNGRKN